MYAWVRFLLCDVADFCTRSFVLRSKTRFDTQKQPPKRRLFLLCVIEFVRLVLRLTGQVYAQLAEGALVNLREQHGGVYLTAA